jgi:hypothetical protein
MNAPNAAEVSQVTDAALATAGAETFDGSAGADVFNPGRILAEAAQIEPGCEFDHVDGLEVLCESLAREAKCTASGAVATRDGLVQSLVMQARVRRQAHEQPEVAAVPVDHAVFIVGFPRTGTTLLHNLLAQNPGLRCPNLWELLTPAGARSVGEQTAARRRAEAYVEWYYKSAERMPAIHPMDAGRPDECQRLLTNAFRSPIYWVRHDVPSYAQWLNRQDLTRAYQFHRLQLQSILWRIPGAVPVLKDPFHIWNLSVLGRVYPRARYIFLHRDPAVSLVSTCSLTAVARGARSQHIDGPAIGRFWLGQFEEVLDRVEADRRATVPEGAALDIDYKDLTRDPMGMAQRISAFLDVPFSAEATARTQAFLDENPLRGKGAHDYAASDFGFAKGQLDERFAPHRRSPVV